MKKGEKSFTIANKIPPTHLYELNKDLDILTNLTPKKNKKIQNFKKYVLSQFTEKKLQKEPYYLFSLGTQMVATLKFLSSGIYKEETLLSEWFGRLTVDLLESIKHNFYKIPTEYTEELSSLINEIKNKYPKYYKKILSKYLTYEYDDLFYPYLNKSLRYEDYVKNLKSISIEKIKREVPNKLKVHIVIPFLFSDDVKYASRFEYFANNFERISQQSYKNIKTYVIFCNAEGKDGFIAKFKEEHSIDVVAMSNVNVGGSRARNILTEKILVNANENDYIIYLDDDTFLNDNNLIFKMLYAFKKQPKLGCLAPQIAYGSPHIQTIRNPIMDSGYEPPWQFSVFSEFEKLDKEKMQEYPPLLKETFLVEASCLIIPALYIKKTGLYPEEYNYYHEETLVESRIRLKLNKIVAVMENAYALHQRIGGGNVSKHAMYYYFRNFGYLLHDLKVNKKSLKAYNLIMSQFYDFCLYLISGRNNEEELNKKLRKGKNDLETYEQSRQRFRMDSIFNADGEYKFI